MKPMPLVALVTALLLAPLAAMALGSDYNCLTLPQGSGFGDPIYQSICADLTAGPIAAQRQAYLGLRWSLGPDFGAPRLTVGLRALRGLGADHLKGADLSASLDLAGGLALHDLRLGVLGGRPAAMVELGAGYALAGHEPLVTASAGRGALRIGADYGLFTRRAEPFFAIDSASAPSRSASTCPADFQLAHLSTHGEPGTVVFIDSDHPLGFDLQSEFCLQQGPVFDPH